MSAELFPLELPPCPKSGHKPHVKQEKSSLIVVWHRIHCVICNIGAGAETYEEAAAKWRKLCAGWNK